MVPNTWQGARIVDQAIEALRQRGISEARIFANRLALLGEIKEDLKKQINDAGEAEFRQMLSAGELSFSLVSSNDLHLNWELAQTLELDVLDADQVLTRQNGTPIEKSYLEPIYRKQVNVLEERVAWYLDGDDAVKWWHRIAVRQDWSLQGWQRGRVYPDFLARLDGGGSGVVRFTVLETKGLHLAGSADTAYKEKLFNLLTQHSQTAVLHAGELGTERSHQVLAVKRLQDVVLPLTIVHDPWYFRGA